MKGAPFFPDFGRTFARYRRGQRHHDLAAGCAVFQRVLDQVLEQPQQLLAVSRDRHRRVRQIDLDRNLALARQRLQPVRHLPDDRDDIHQRIGADMGGEFDPRQRQQIVDQPRHPGCLRVHDAEKALARLGIVPGRPLQGIDEA